MRIFVKKEAMCLLACYLWQYRRLCSLAFDNQISWLEITKYYQSNYLDRNIYVLPNSVKESPRLVHKFVLADFSAVLFRFSIFLSQKYTPLSLNGWLASSNA